MVLESFLTPNDARKNSWSLFFLGFVYSSIAIILSLIVFPSQTSEFTIFLTTLASAPLFVSILKDEESAHIGFLEKPAPVFKEHLDVLGVFFFLFLGFTVSFSLWFSFLPEAELDLVFNQQLNDLTAMNSLVSGNFFNNDLALLILKNNLRVLFFCFLFSFVYGAGAVLILSWNASVLGTAVGLFIREKMGDVLGANIAVFLSNLPYGLGQYMFHGIFEVLAYFMASLAGGLVSAAIIRKRYKSRNLLKLTKNTSFLLGGAIILLVIAAFIEGSL